MNLTVDQTGDSPTFLFESPLRLSSLIVTEPATETIVWDIYTIALTRCGALDGLVVSIQLEEVSEEMLELVKRAAPMSDEHVNVTAALQKVVYGVLPDGFAERRHALSLSEEAEYRVSVTGDGFEHASKLFRLTNRT
jgi:hypothetical protein